MIAPVSSSSGLRSSDRRSRAARVIAALLVAASSTTATTAHAGEAEDKARAAELKKRGTDAFERRDYEEAVRADTESYALGKDPALLYNRARALEALGRYPEALDDLDRFAKEASPELLSRVPGLPDLRRAVARRVATLVVATSTAGARVTLGDRVLGKTPLPPTRVTAGAARLEITADGFRPFTRDLELKGDAEASVTVELVPVERKATLVVRERDGRAASVDVDGRAYGVAPAELPVDAGSHRVTLRLDGKETSSSVVVGSGERRVVTLAADGTPGVLSTWWFWTGVGVVVVSGVVAYVALTTERKADKGDISPGQLATPLVRF